MSKNFRILITIITIALITLACGLGGSNSNEETTQPPAASSTLETTPESEIELGEIISSDEGGYSFRTIPDWKTQSAMGMTTVDAPDADEENGPGLILIGEKRQESTTLEALFEEFSSGSDITLSNKQDTTINGMQGLVADMSPSSGDQEATGKIIIVMVKPEQSFILAGFAPKTRWDTEVAKLFDAVLASLKFFDAKPVKLTETVRQWASSATASSEYGNPDWAASQATGEPNTTVCGDFSTAWASAESYSVDWIELNYDVPVTPTQVNIYQTQNPSQVVKVELLDDGGAYHEVYSSKPQTTNCPYTLTVDVSGADYLATGVKLTIDQSQLELAWNEIDAVELVGEGSVGSASVSPTTTSNDSGQSNETSAGFLWRIGGKSGISDGEFANLHDMAISDDNLVYLTDNVHGVYVFTLDGQQTNVIHLDDFNQTTGIDIGPDGNLYIADWGANAIFIVTPDGQLVTKIGGTQGNGNGEFGTFSPDSVAVASDGKIYAMDENKDANDKDFNRVQIFNSNGSFIKSFQITEEFFSPGGMTFGPDGNLYIAAFVGGYILKCDPDGNVLGKIGEDILMSSGAQGISIDDAGNFYLSVWTPKGAIKLDPEGKQIAQFGFEVQDGKTEWPEGGFYSPGGITVLPDGSRVFIADWSGDYSFMTAFEFPKN